MSDLYTFRQYTCPPLLRESLDAWAETARPCGSFLMAVLENNLMEAMGRADPTSTTNLPAIVAYVYNEMPSACHGSRQKVRDWMKAKAA